MEAVCTVFHQNTMLTGVGMILNSAELCVALKECFNKIK